MVGGWLLKVVLGIALVGLAVIELGSPLVARAQADDAAHEVATEAAFQYGRSPDVEAMQVRCAEVAEDKDVTLDACGIDAEGRVAVTVSKKAVSLLLHKVSLTEDWYDVSVSATSAPR